MMYKSSPAIVVVAYDRKESLLRLLSSLEAADYPRECGRGADGVNLIISVDRSGSSEVEKAAENFRWSHGRCTVVKHQEKMGLKRHVLECGSYALRYGSCIVLEDDLAVSPDFYSYTCQALDFTGGDEKVAGISLYGHRFNVFARLPFEPIYDGFDNWYFQFASSWGQAWSAPQWQGFMEWMKERGGGGIEGGGLPADVAAWKENSWLKYAIKYCIDTDRYYLYPRVSLTTNFADEGEHARFKVTDLQVPLSLGRKREYLFSTLKESSSVYDAYFENARLGFASDIYGIKVRDGFREDPDSFFTPGRAPWNGGKGDGRRLLLSAAPLPLKVVGSYALELKPPDANIVLNLPGDALRLYDLDVYRSALTGKMEGGRGRFERYYYPGMNARRMRELFLSRLTGR